MAIEKIQINDFLQLGKRFPVLDVRSPGEYGHAHIPGAHNLPLFTDEERKIVGTTYKQVSREAAIKTGLDFFGPKMRQMVEQVESLFNALPTGMGSKHVLVNCWRGGMRSAGVAWLLDLYGFKVSTLIGGYKSYRHWIGQTFSFPFFFHVLGGYSGSAKTYLLEEMRNRGAAVINLEYLAGHKGSAFGNIGMPKQPTQEMFENLLGNELSAFMTHKDPVPGAETPSSYEHPVWVEDESQRIGQINIPHALWNTISQSPVIFISIPFEERLQHILQEYSNLDKEKLADGITRIKKRLGGLEAKTALQYLADGDIESCFRILLRYYDKLYCKAMDKRDQSKLLLTDIECSSVDLRLNAGKILTNELLVK